MKSAFSNLVVIILLTVATTVLDSCEPVDLKDGAALNESLSGRAKAEPLADCTIRINGSDLFVNDRPIIKTDDISDRNFPEQKIKVLYDALKSIDSYGQSGSYPAINASVTPDDRSAIVEMSGDVRFEVLRLVMTNLAMAGFPLMGLTMTGSDEPPVWIDQRTRALGASNSGIQVIGDSGVDVDLASSLGAFGGTMGGGGFRGTGAWGGGDENTRADLRGIAGLGPKDAHGAASGVKFTKGTEPRVFTGDITVTGGMDRETVRRYIQTKMDQIRWCYQQELQKYPDLAGEIRMQWTILPTGFASGVKVDDSTIRKAAVERCVTERIVKWRFPAPKGGNPVQVFYSFIFRLTK